jgi:hypothetical protein
MIVKCNIHQTKNNTNGTISNQNNSSKSDGSAYTTRWADTKTWSLDFKKTLAPGIKCTLSLNQIKDLRGSEVSGLNEYSFSTTGPTIAFFDSF